MKSMFDELTTTVWLYGQFYVRWAEHRWSVIGPSDYGIILISVGVFGWLLMRSASRK